MTHPSLNDEPIEGRKVRFGGTGDWERCRQNQQLHIFGDGSGGRVSADPGRRRCGASVAGIRCEDEECRVGAALAAPLLGPRQAAPRSEILAFALALEERQSSFAFVTDHRAVARTWRYRLEHQKATDSNEDLRSRVRVAPHNRPRKDIQIIWTASHSARRLRN